MSESHARRLTYSPLLTVTTSRDRALHSRVELPVLALADQAYLLELRRHCLPGHQPRVLEARDDTKCQPCVSLNYAMDGQCYVGMEWLVYWKRVFESPLAIRPYMVPPLFSYL